MKEVILNQPLSLTENQPKGIPIHGKNEFQNPFHEIFHKSQNALESLNSKLSLLPENIKKNLSNLLFLLQKENIKQTGQELSALDLKQLENELKQLLLSSPFFQNLLMNSDFSEMIQQIDQKELLKPLIQFVMLHQDLTNDLVVNDEEIQINKENFLKLHKLFKKYQIPIDDELYIDQNINSHIYMPDLLSHEHDEIQTDSPPYIIFQKGDIQDFVKGNVSEFMNNFKTKTEILDNPDHEQEHPIDRLPLKHSKEKNSDHSGLNLSYFLNPNIENQIENSLWLNGDSVQVSLQPVAQDTFYQNNTEISSKVDNLSDETPYKTQGHPDFDAIPVYEDSSIQGVSDMLKPDLSISEEIFDGPLEIDHSQQKQNQPSKSILNETQGTHEIPEAMIKNPVFQRNVARQVFQATIFAAHQKHQEIIVKLRPPELGNVLVKFSNSTEGVKTQIEVETEAAKYIIDKQIVQLKENLQKQGFEVQQIQVHLNQERNMNQERRYQQHMAVHMLRENHGNEEIKDVAEELISRPKNIENRLDLIA